MSKKDKEQNKPIENTYDQFEVLAKFCDETEEYLKKKFKVSHRTFIIKCIVGVLLTINVWMSHWFPLPWPKNYYLIVGCVIFYYVASYYFESLDQVKKSTGKLVGDFFKPTGESFQVVATFQNWKPEIVLEELVGKTKKRGNSASFSYPTFVDSDGNVLRESYRAWLEKSFI